jgi:hypothetical protein
MASTRTLLIVLGLGIAIAGLVVARGIDQIVGMAMLIVGGLVVILPFTASTEDEQAVMSTDSTVAYAPSAPSGPRNDHHTGHRMRSGDVPLSGGMRHGEEPSGSSLASNQTRVRPRW